ncbi:hypothetical protein, partial [Bradyrhizobium diazoefficiens]|uniref:hypothetical protein n=1 Tax=Bradyrhizobium diazoefficiens TaxID=1355477 RepID=UPI0030B756E8
AQRRDRQPVVPVQPAALTSFSAPRITILSAPSGNGRCNAFAHPTARASRHHAARLRRQDHGIVFE